jgi:ribosomal protein S18 acetylase RimI-like enzyme
MLIHIRDATLDDAPALARVIITATQAAFHGRVPERCLNWLTEDESAANWRRALGTGGMPEGTFLVVAADVDGLVVGYAMGGRSEADPGYDGELKQLQVLPAYQRRGIGRHLVRYVAARLASQGMRSLVVGVLVVNPNRPFYERHGGRYLRERPFDWDGYIVAEALYGWSDLAQLIGPDP